MENKRIYGILGVLSLVVAAMGGSMFLTEDQLDNAFVCSINENVLLGVDHLSSTYKTAYWFENDVQKSKVCRGGFWLDLKQYAKDNNIELNILLQNTNEQSIESISNSVEGIKWKCSSESCVKILDR